MSSGNLSENTLIEYMLMRDEVAVPSIVRDLGVSPSTAVSMIARLLEKGIAAKREQPTPAGKAKRGRPVIIYQLHVPGRVLALGMDGSLLAGMIFDRELSVIASAQLRLDGVAQHELVVPMVERIARRLAIESVGAVPGHESISTQDLLGRANVEDVALVANAVDIGGKAMTSSVMPWVNQTLPTQLADALGLTVTTPANIVAAAEFRVMNEPRPDPMLLLHVADGVSAHTVAGGNAFAGANQLSGELGHITVDLEGPLCGCGRRGCLETYCSGPAIIRRLIEGLKSGAGSDLHADVLESLSPRQAIELVHDSYVAGDSFARDTMDRVLERLAWGVGIATNLFDPQAVALGGYVLQNKPSWHDQIAERAKRWTMHAARRETRFVDARANLADELRLAALRVHFDPSSRRTAPSSVSATAR